MSQTVLRALGIVDLVAESPRTLTEIGEAIGTHKSTALRLLQTLESAGYVRQLPTGEYVAGLALVRLAESALSTVDARSIARPTLQALSARLGHTVHFAQRVDDDIVYIDKIDGNGTVAMGSRVGSPAEKHTAGVAKAIIAFASAPERDRMIAAARFTAHTPNTIPDEAAFRREIAATRARGWAEDDGENEDYINCIAFPVRDATGQFSYAFSVTALKAVGPLPELRALASDLQGIADTLSAALGWAGSGATEAP